MRLLDQQAIYNWKDFRCQGVSNPETARSAGHLQLERFLLSGVSNHESARSAGHLQLERFPLPGGVK